MIVVVVNPIFTGRVIALVEMYTWLGPNLNFSLSSPNIEIHVNFDKKNVLFDLLQTVLSSEYL